MARIGYSVERLQGKWVVLVSGAKVLTCQKKSIALTAARGAMALLLQQQQTSTTERRVTRGFCPSSQVGSKEGASFQME
jgi:hypothetical protein